MSRFTLGALLFGLSGPAAADTILYCNDYNVGADRMGMAVDSFSGTHTITKSTSM